MQKYFLLFSSKSVGDLWQSMSQSVIDVILRLTAVAPTISPPGPLMPGSTSLVSPRGFLGLGLQSATPDTSAGVHWEAPHSFECHGQGWGHLGLLQEGAAGALGGVAVACGVAVVL